ncbi:YbaB/EbfC family nucleoid-associated protein [Amycolatopsis acidiphila]|uniref:YbaB/EbfC family nucleoid-associated protein n=1 Tax=Amycolatopsis acidiphila TaxID=715473 RepID=A0A557ZWE6_9PSEU|nr:YbaB/EbfC family nucleoid-associated protein [Amycolatopsis acidiphila]TVT16337.1 YbaB/EbfC family nucleoid-associated protein [Amycolatopsis acidiphila]UIJ61221.1 YbaB/EbfC family nucleoid-associated protein [Amycolatopsis acidiphila]GHG97726.1 DNA-binding protein [Amycolatopsis acidiphila]
MTAPNGLGGLMRDPDEAARQIDAWAEGFAQKAERYRAAQERTEEIRLSSSNTDGSVRVTVRADGSVTDLNLSGRARSMPLEELSAQILTTMRRAQSGIAERVSEVMTEEVGDEDPETRSLLVDNLRSRFPSLDADEDEEPADEPPDEPQRPASSGNAENDDEDNNPW